MYIKKIVLLTNKQYCFYKMNKNLPLLLFKIQDLIICSIVLNIFDIIVFCNFKKL